MGFGLICAGYSTLIFLRLVPVEIIGFYFVLKGLRMLRSYNSYFRYAEKSIYPILLFSLADVIYFILERMGIATSHVAADIFTYLHRLLLLPFYFLLFYALRKISADLGYDKGVKKATLAISTTLVYYLVFAVSRIDLGDFRQYFIAAEIILFLLLFFVSESAIYACYRAITTDEAEKKEEEQLKKFEERFGRKKNKNKDLKSNDIHKNNSKKK